MFAIATVAHDQDETKLALVTMVDDDKAISVTKEEFTAILWGFKLVK